MYTKEKISQDKIGRKHHAHQIAISKILKHNGIQTRKRYGSTHGSWKGGRIKISQDYILIWIDHNHKYWCMSQKGGYVLEHRLVMAEKLGRSLKQNETVYHINGIKNDNRPENFELRKGKHGRGIFYQCGDCGSKNIIEINLNTF